MSLVQNKLFKFTAIISRVNLCALSSSAKAVNEKDIKKSVFISQSKDIYTNLALEDWIYKNFDLSSHHVLMLWKNDPCVVVGRHQNPWLEANIPELDNITEDGVKLARRNSGGGAVYHDNGNLNLTFFTPVERYNRKYNLEIITRALFREYGLKSNINKREDLTVNDYKVSFFDKISGTASKLGRPNSYHHCTLLVNVNKLDLSQALAKDEAGVKTNATRSVKSKVMNLCEENRKVSVDTLLRAVGWEYMRTPACTIKDGGEELAHQQKGFQMINPTEQWFPGLNAIRDDLQSWDWCYGKTPKFTITRSFPIPENLLGQMYESALDLKVTMEVEKGRISDVTLFIPPGFSLTGFTGEATVITTLKGQKFSHETLKVFEDAFAGLVDDRDKFVTDCVRRVMTSV